MPYPSGVVRCARCGQMFTWRIHPRGQVTAINDDMVLGGDIELVGDDGYRNIIPHPTIEAARFHSEVCDAVHNS